MAKGSSRSRLRDEINKRLNEMDDEQLVELAWSEFTAWEAGPAAKDFVLHDLEEAERQIDSQAVPGPAARRRIKRFLVTKYINDHEPKSKS